MANEPSHYRHCRSFSRPVPLAVSRIGGWVLSTLAGVCAMTYDNWKATEPDYDDGEVRGSCDCCDKYRVLHQVMSRSCGETWACAECLGYEPEDDDQQRMDYELGQP